MQVKSDNNISRRSFIHIMGGAAFAGALLGLSGCGGTGTKSSSGSSSSDSKAGGDGTIRFGCDASYAPYEWKQDSESEYTLPIENISGYVDGYDIQLMKTVGKKLGKTPVVVNVSFTGLIAALQNGEIDAICSGMSATDERKQSVDFSHAYLTSGVGVLVAKDSKYASATSLKDLSGASIIGSKSSLPDSVIDQIPNVKHVDPVDSVPDTIARVIQGTVDGAAVDANNKDIYEKQYPNFVVLTFEDGKGFDTPGVDPAIAVKKGDPEGILSGINEAIDSLSEDDRKKLWDECSERAPQ